jgi:hypothetical protein
MIEVRAEVVCNRAGRVEVSDLGKTLTNLLQGIVASSDRDDEDISER